MAVTTLIVDAAPTTAGTTLSATALNVPSQSGAFLISGGIPGSPSASLVQAQPAAEAVINPGSSLPSYVKVASTTVTMGAGGVAKDNYVDLNANGTYTVTTYAAGTANPSPAAGTAVRLYRATTNAGNTAVSTITQLASNLQTPPGFIQADFVEASTFDTLVPATGALTNSLNRIRAVLATITGGSWIATKPALFTDGSNASGTMNFGSSAFTIGNLTVGIVTSTGNSTFTGNVNVTGTLTAGNLSYGGGTTLTSLTVTPGTSALQAVTATSIALANSSSTLNMAGGVINAIQALNSSSANWAITNAGNAAFVGTLSAGGTSVGSLSSTAFITATGLLTAGSGSFLGDVNFNSHNQTNVAQINAPSNTFQIGTQSWLPNGLGVGVLGQAVGGQGLQVKNTPVATANYGTANLGDGPFDAAGAAANRFVGGGSGTILAINGASGSSADLLAVQAAGTSLIRVSPTALTVNAPASLLAAVSLGTSSSNIVQIFGNAIFRAKQYSSAALLSGVTNLATSCSEGSIVVNDEHRGSISFIVGASVNPSGALFRVGFSSNYTTAPVVVVSSGSPLVDFSGRAPVFIVTNVTTSSFEVWAPNALASNVTYIINYVVIG